MVKIFILSFLLTSLQNTFALNGTITVLEAPLFANPDETTRVIQYYRKGQLIFIHPQEAVRDQYEDKINQLIVGVEPDVPDDTLFENNKVYYPNEQSAYYKTISRNGNQAYILKEHVLLNFKDKREFTQKAIVYDHTDYRIHEPLLEGYPLIQESGYRGMTQFALGRPNFQAYPYTENISDMEIDFSKEFSFIWSKARVENKDKRFFFGTMFTLHSSSIDYRLSTLLAAQDNLRFSIGPSASYDILKSKKRTLNVYFSMQAYLFDAMEITIEDPINGVNDKRSYNSLFSISNVLGLNAIFTKTFLTYDTVIGTNLRLNLPKTYKTTTSPSQESFWNSSKTKDNFYQPFTAEINFYLGFQSDY